MLPAHRQHRVEEIFLAALACEDPAARERLLLEQCAGDAPLLAEVRSLLGGHDHIGGVLDHRSLVERISLGFGAAPTVSMAGGEPSLPPGTRIAGYTLERVIGAGGMGVVYVAEQERPRRTVAVKLIRLAGASPSLLRRFEVEAEILGRLHHPGIAQIFEAGMARIVPPEADGPPSALASVERPFLAMELIDGLPITEHAEKEKLSTAQRLGLMAEVCDAVQHAHQRGIIHRDLKPSNILVESGSAGQRGGGPGGRVTPKILDFGVARVTDSDMRVTTLQTSVGQLIGTLPYMSPEQVAGDPEAVDTRSDVYALGVVLYQLLTGRLPHDVASHSIPEAARIIRDEHPSRLSQVSRVFRGDVDTIVGRAMEKDPARRYQSAADLAEDLRRFIAGEPILAKRDSIGYVLNKRLRRYRALVAVGAVALVLVTGLGIYAGIAAVRARRLASQLAIQLSDSVIERARLLARTDQAGVAEEVLWGEAVKRPDSPLARWALWDLYSYSPCLATIPTWEAVSFDVAFSPDGKHSAISNRVGGKVEIWDADLTHLQHALNVGAERAFAATFSPDSHMLATGDTDGRLKLWDARSGECTATRQVHAEWIGSVVYSPDGRVIATAGKEGIVRLWTATDLSPAGELSGHEGEIYSLAFSPDNSLLASTSADHSARIWDLASGRCIQVLDKARGGHDFNVSACAFSPDGSTLVTGGFDKRIKLWDIPAYTCRATIRDLPGHPETIAFAPDGSRFYLSADAIQIRSSQDGELIQTLMSADSTRRALALDPSGARILTGSGRGRISLWETSPQLARRELQTGVSYPGDATFSADGRRLIATGPKGAIGIRDPADPAAVTELSGHKSMVRSVATSADGRWLVSGGIDGQMMVWDLATSQSVGTVAAHLPGTAISALACSPDSSVVASLGLDRHARLWRLPSLEPAGDIDISTFNWRGPGAMIALAWSPDGSRLAVGTGLDKMGIWRTAPLDLAVICDVGASQSAVAFSRDGRSLAVGIDRAILDVDPDTGAIRRRLPGHSQSVTGLAFAADNLLISGSRDRTIRLWEWTTGRSLVSLPTGAQGLQNMTVSSDLHWVAGTLDRGALVLWDLDYYDRHIAGNLDWNMNAMQPPLPTETRRRVRQFLGAEPKQTQSGR